MLCREAVFARACQIIIGSHVIPMWISYFGIVIPALLAILLLREKRNP